MSIFRPLLSSLTLAAAALLLCADVNAKRIYQYRDKDGVLHFTDRRVMSPVRLPLSWPTPGNRAFHAALAVLFLFAAFSARSFAGSSNPLRRKSSNPIRSRRRNAHSSNGPASPTEKPSRKLPWYSATADSSFSVPTSR